jgi:mono/diheme cytochrome c family protein
MRIALACALVAAGIATVRGTPAPAGAARDTTLRFLQNGRVVRTLDLQALTSRCTVETIEIDDPYYERRKRFRACPLGQVLEIGFGPLDRAFDREDVFLRARDGYVKPASGARLREPGGYLAFADAERAHGDDPGWEPIDRRQVDPGPYYVVWATPAQRDVHRYPWPYQLADIEIASFAAVYPHTIPRAAPPGSGAWAGFDVFRGDCIACHAINGEGGKIGPDLNVPRSIVEYRPAEQIKAYIRDPAAFRYTSMPAHPHLSPRQLDDLLSYFAVMQTLKHDPGRAP